MRQASAKFFWRIIGWILFLFGLLGLLVPLFPTTIFWILAALAWRKSDPAFAERIRQWPKIGPTVADFLDHGVISPMGKFTAIAAMGASGALMAALIDNPVGLAVALSALALIALYVGTRPSRPKAAFSAE
ncbi:MAG: DUF454 family protein [Pseudomonadota bacterium]